MKSLEKLSSALKSASLEKESNLIKGLAETGQIKVALLSDQEVSDGLKYHIDNNIPITESIYREFSDKYFEVMKEAKALYEEEKLIVSADSEWILSDDCGKFAEFQEMVVPLDFPMSIEDEEHILKQAAEYKGKNVKLNNPRTLRKGEPGHGRKQYVVYVKKDNGKVKRITFGDPNLKAKPEHKKNRKSFRARHKCDQKKDKTTPGYWACRHPPNW